MNVSKGQVASKEDLQKCFKTEDEEMIIEEVHNSFLSYYSLIALLKILFFF